MPQFHENKAYPQTWTLDDPKRTDNMLFRSDGVAPTDDLEPALLSANQIDGAGVVRIGHAGTSTTVDASAGNKAFYYQFGQEFGLPDQGLVIIGKGNFLSFVDSADEDDGKLTFAYNIAGADEHGQSGTGLRSYPIGINPMHIYAPVEDQFSSNIPVYVTQGYVELPYIEDGGATGAQLCKTGCVYGSNIKNGDLLTVAKTVANRGQLTKAVAGDIVVARAGVVDTNMPPEGWLEWVQFEPWWMYRDKDFYNTPAEMPPYDSPDTNWFNPQMDYPSARGIKGLTDGAIMDKQSTLTRTYFLTEADAAALNAASNITIDLPYFAWAGVGDMLRHGIDTGANTVIVAPVAGDLTTSDAVFAADALANHAAKGACELAPAGAGYAEGDRLVISYECTGQVHGIPVNLDRVGSVGAVRLLVYACPFILDS